MPSTPRFSQIANAQSEDCPSSRCTEWSQRTQQADAKLLRGCAPLVDVDTHVTKRPAANASGILVRMLELIPQVLEVVDIDNGLELSDRRLERRLSETLSNLGDPPEHAHRDRPQLGLDVAVPQLSGLSERRLLEAPMRQLDRPTPQMHVQPYPMRIGRLPSRSRRVSQASRIWFRDQTLDKDFGTPGITR